jgi:hypothetical protein
MSDPEIKITMEQSALEAKTKRKFEEKYRYLLTDWEKVPHKPYNVQEAAQHIMHNTHALDKLMIEEFLGEENKIAQAILQECANIFFAENKNKDLSFIQALRGFSSKFYIPSEAQKLDRYMTAFGKAYHQTHEGVFQDENSAIIFAFSILQLTADLHSEKIKKHQTKEEFVHSNIMASVDAILNLSGAGYEKESTALKLKSTLVELGKMQVLDKASLKRQWEPLLIFRLKNALQRIEVPTTPANKRVETLLLNSFGITLKSDEVDKVRQAINDMDEHALDLLVKEFANNIIEVKIDNAVKALNHLTDDFKRVEATFDDISAAKLDASDLKAKPVFQSANTLLEQLEKISLSHPFTYESLMKAELESFAKQLKGLEPTNKQLVIDHIKNKIDEYRLVNGDFLTLGIYQVFLEKIKSSVVSPTQTKKPRMSIMSSMPLFMNVQEKANKLEKDTQHILKTLQSIIDVGQIDKVDPKELTQNLVFLSENELLKNLNRLRNQKITLDFPPKYLETASTQKVIEAVYTANMLFQAGCEVVVPKSLNEALSKISGDKKLAVTYQELILTFQLNQQKPETGGPYTPSTTNLKPVTMHITEPEKPEIPDVSSQKPSKPGSP